MHADREQPRNAGFWRAELPTRCPAFEVFASGSKEATFAIVKGEDVTHR